MGQIANQMVIEMIYKMKQIIQDKKEQNKNNRQSDKVKKNGNKEQ